MERTSDLADMLATPKMNYAAVILAFVCLIALAYWYIHGRFYYYGPRTQAHIVDGMIVSADSQGSGMDQEKGPEAHVIK